MANRKDISLQAESIRIALQKLSTTLNDLMTDASGEEGWPAACETLKAVKSNIDRCEEMLFNRFTHRVQDTLDKKYFMGAQGEHWV